MYKRLERNITIYHLRDSVDDYGQPRLEWDSKVESKGSFYLTSQMNATNPDFLDVDAVLVLRENYLDSHYIIEIDDQKYRIKYSLPVRPVRSRFTQYLLVDTNESPEEYIENGIFWKIEEHIDPYSPIYNEYRLYIRATPAEGYQKENPVDENAQPSWFDRRTEIKRVYIEEEIQPTTVAYWFKEMPLVGFTGYENINLLNCTNMYHMFHTCSTTGIGDIKFKTGCPKNTNLQSVFKDCHCTSIDVTGICPSTVTTLNSTFYGTTASIISGLGTWDTSNVVRFNSLFNNCTYLQRIDGIANWNTSNGEVFNNTFSRCTNLPFIDISGWDVSKATTLKEMFRASSARSINIKNFKPNAGLTSIQNMFYWCSNLLCINCDDTTFAVPDGCTKTGVFTDCWNLPGFSGGTGGDYWSDYVTSNSPVCVTPELNDIYLNQINFKFLWNQGDEVVSYSVLPYWEAGSTSIPFWELYGPDYGDYARFGIDYGMYNNLNNRDNPFRAILASPGKLCSYLDYPYEIVGDLQLDFSLNYNNETQMLEFVNGTLAEGEWYTFTVRKDGYWFTSEPWVDSNTFPLELTDPGEYTISAKKCKQHYNSTSTVNLYINIGE